MIDFSIVIPTKNEEKNIKKCLESIINQKKVKIEIIIIDGYSTDKTINISKKIKKNKNIIIRNIFFKGPAEKAIAKGIHLAKGKYVVPGGIDAHTHMELPFGGTYASDTFETGSRAAAWGGTTTIIDFAVQRYGENVRDSLDEWFAKAEGECAVDYAFHMILGGVDDAALKEMDTLVSEGITSFKLFMAYPGVFYSDDGQILRAMQKASKLFWTKLSGKPCRMESLITLRSFF